MRCLVKEATSLTCQECGGPFWMGSIRNLTSTGWTCEPCDNRALSLPMRRPDGTLSPCYCPSACTCRNPYRLTICGCLQHEDNQP